MEPNILVPGMRHCGGGPALDQFDMLSAVVNWVEKGSAPESLPPRERRFPAEAGRCAHIPSTPSIRGMETLTTPITSYVSEPGQSYHPAGFGLETSLRFG